MNMISQLRQKIGRTGFALINVDEFNQLQGEWITRANIEPGTIDPIAVLQFKNGMPVTHQETNKDPK